MKGLKKAIGLLPALLAMMSCAGIDCPLNNAVYSHWSFYQGDRAATLEDTLYVYAKANGRDTLLINRLYHAQHMDLPLSYYQQADTFRLEVHHATGETGYAVWQEEIIIAKDNLEHFNSPECGVWHEHSITGMKHSTVLIDSIQVVKPKIDTHEEENFRIYFK